MAAVRGRPSGLPGGVFPVRQPACSCHLFVWRRIGGSYANAAARILAVTQLFESLNRLDLSAADGVDLKHITQPCAILLRDGCDLLDVLGQRLQV